MTTVEKATALEQKTNGEDFFADFDREQVAPDPTRPSGRSNRTGE